MIIDENKIFYQPVLWVVDFIAMNYGVDICSLKNGDIRVGITEEDDIRLSMLFYDNILVKNNYKHEYHFSEGTFIQLENGSPDYLSTIFYLVNCIQEYDVENIYLDKYNRFDFQTSLQSKYGVLEKDLVKKYVQNLLYSIDPKLDIVEKKTKIFISHDIDFVYGSWKVDGVNAIKNNKIFEALKVGVRSIKKDPPWMNMDKIAELENEYNVKACYYWITKNGRDSFGIKNGDYNIKSDIVQRQIQKVIEYGNEIGLHKSTLDFTVQEEFESLDVKEMHNRYHFLKMLVPQGLSDLECARVQSDASLGYADNMGFRNSCGMPFFPYDLKQRKTLDVLEIPLHIMDGMFEISNEEESNITYQRIISFIEENSTNTVISILWHNSELTEYTYKWSFACYKKILLYIQESEYETILPSELILEYSK